MRPALRLFIALLFLLVAGGLPLAVIAAAVDATPTARPIPPCSDRPKSSIVELDPAGTMNALAQVTYTVPFCPGGTIVTLATVDNGNTAGERVGAKPFGLTHINVSIQLDAPSNDTYFVYWEAKKATQ